MDIKVEMSWLDYEAMLEERLDYWDDDATEGEKSLSKEFIRNLHDLAEAGVAMKDVMEVVDNYIFNSEIISRKEYDEYPERFDTRYSCWEDIQQDALFFNDDYACIQY